MSRIDKIYIGRSIRSQRESKGLSLRELSREIGVPYTSLGKIENGEQRVDGETLIKLAELFGVSLNQLLNHSVTTNEMSELKKLPRRNQLILVEHLQFVLGNYLKSKTEQFKGHAMGSFIRENLKSSFIKGVPLNESKYQVTGSVGQGQWAEIPWLCIFSRNVTNSATRGYYVVYLFKADMSGFYLSLNQGYSFFQEKYGNKIGKQKVKKVADSIRGKLNFVPPRLQQDKIHLNGTGYLSKGYEEGHILGRYYSLEELDNPSELVQDLQDLLVAYKEIEGMLEGRTIDQFNNMVLLEDDQQFLEIEESEEKYQETVSSVVTDTNGEVEDDERAEPRPDAIIDKGGKRRWPRNAKIAAKALKKAGYKCESGEVYMEFISKVTGKPYMEAHHLVPMALQHKYENSLDKGSNILCLSPAIHRLLHHGLDIERERLLRKLYEKKNEGLKRVGITISFDELKVAYGIV